MTCDGILGCEDCCTCGALVDTAVEKLCCGVCESNCIGCWNNVFDFVSCLKCLFFLVFSIPILLLKILKSFFCCLLPILLALGALLLLSYLLSILCGPITILLDFLAFATVNIVAGQHIAASYASDQRLDDDGSVDVTDDRITEVFYQRFMDIKSPLSEKIVGMFLLERKMTKYPETFTVSDAVKSRNMFSFMRYQYNIDLDSARLRLLEWISDRKEGSGRINTRYLLQILDVLSCFVGGFNFLCFLGFVIDVPVANLPDFLTDLSDFDCDGCSDYNGNGCFSLDGLCDALLALQTYISFGTSFIPGLSSLPLPQAIADILFLDGDVGGLPSIDQIACAVINSQCLILAIAALFTFFIILDQILDWLCELFECFNRIRTNSKIKRLLEERKRCMIDDVYELRERTNCVVRDQPCGSFLCENINNVDACIDGKRSQMCEKRGGECKAGFMGYRNDHVPYQDTFSKLAKIADALSPFDRNQSVCTCPVFGSEGKKHV